MTSNIVQRIPHLLSRLVAAMLFLLAGQLLVLAVGDPTITSFTPTRGPIGTVVTITGTNFYDLVDIELAAHLTTYTVVNSTTLKVVIPPDAVTGTFYVITSHGGVISDDFFDVSPLFSVNTKDTAQLAWVPAGDFTRGTIPGFGMQAEHPQSTITLDGYWIYRDEVTVAQYQAFCTATSRNMPTAPSWGWIATHPIVNVTWNDAKDYADWAGVKLPTEAQWEKAARGTDKRNYPWGGYT
ncbi:MAG: SUMF1/EgtB/PvdO family nonheme iron enzyme, partial [bacterium]